MITSSDLLEVARAAIHTGATPAALSRATSTLYYALFHALLEEARGRVRDCSNAELLRRYTAAYDHKALAEAAKHVRACSDKALRKITKGGAPAPWTALFPEHPSEPESRAPSVEMLDVCETFSKLQDLRHQADYYAEWAVTLPDAQQYLADAERALASWSACAATGESMIFLFGALDVLKYR